LPARTITAGGAIFRWVLFVSIETGCRDPIRNDMPKIVLSMDGLVLKEFFLTKERTAIGRKPHNDIQIDNLSVSGDHAVIILMQGDAFLEDLGSTNGTWVNGKSIRKHFLQNDDCIELGKYRLKYLKAAQDLPEDSGDFEKTTLLRPGRSTGLASGSGGHGMHSMGDSRPKVAVWSSNRKPDVIADPSPKVDMHAALRILAGKSAGRELNLTKILTTLGKAGIQVAVITRRPYGYFITHVEGDAFPSVNGVSLDHQAHALSDQDVIDIAGVKLGFFLKR